MKENIEEDLKIVEKLIKTMEQDRITFKDEQAKEIYAYFIKALENILSDYKRLQEEFKQVDHECERLEQKELRLEKENEELKQMLDERFIYVTGARTVYGRLIQLDKEIIVKDDLKLRNEINQLLKENEELKESYKILQECYWNECVSKQKIKDKIEEFKQERILKYDNYMGYKIESREQQDIDKKINVLQDLLEEKGE